MLKKLPGGSSSNVFADLNNDKNVAIKVLANDDEESKENFRHEFETLKQYGDDKYIIKTYGLSTNDEGKLCMHNEYANGCDILEYISYINYNFDRLHAITYLLKCMAYIESIDLYHGDIKMENIVVFYYDDHRDNVYKLIDFEYSKWMSSHRCVTLRDRDLVSYKTPGMGNDDFEMIRRGLVDKRWPLGKQDVCAMGKTLIDIYHRSTIHYGRCYNDAKFGILHEGFYEKLQDRLEQIIFPLRKTIYSMIRTNPNERLWASQILEELYFVPEN